MEYIKTPQHFSRFILPIGRMSMVSVALSLDLSCRKARVYLVAVSDAFCQHILADMRVFGLSSRVHETCTASDHPMLPQQAGY